MDVWTKTMKKLGNVLIEVMQDLSRVSTNGSAHVRINNHLCEPERFEQLFNHFSRGTLLERIELEVGDLPTKLECSCGYQEKVENPDHKGYSRCPSCGQFANVKDNEYQLVKPDPEKTKPRESIRF